MKATLTFKLPKEKYEHHKAINAWRYAEALSDIWNRFRELEKYGDRPAIQVDEARQIIDEILAENNINFDEL